MGATFKVLFVVHAERNEDFSKGKRAAVVPSDPYKTRITIRLDADIINHFKKLVDDAGGGIFKLMINL